MLFNLFLANGPASRDKHNREIASQCFQNTYHIFIWFTKPVIVRNSELFIHDTVNITKNRGDFGHFTYLRPVCRMTRRAFCYYA